MIDAENVFKILKKVPKGKVTTYKTLASACGNPNAARAVGRILNSNKNLILIPCHRVIKSNGEVGGYAIGKEKKIELLRKDGIEIKNGKAGERLIIREII